MKTFNEIFFEILEPHTCHTHNFMFVNIPEYVRNSIESVYDINDLTLNIEKKEKIKEHREITIYNKKLQLLFWCDYSIGLEYAFNAIVSGKNTMENPTTKLEMIEQICKIITEDAENAGFKNLKLYVAITDADNRNIIQQKFIYTLKYGQVMG